MRAHLILTAEQEQQESLQDALQVLAQEEIHIQTHPSQSPEHRQRTLEELLEQRKEYIAIAGGDGSLHHAAQQWMRRPREERPALGLVPMGTANDFAHAARIPREDLVAALRLAFLAPARPIDVIEANQHYIVNMCTAGAGTQATTQAPSQLKDNLGGWAYLLTGLSQLPHIETRAVEVLAPGFAWSGPIWNASVGNARQAGGGWRLCPLAQIDDGLLDLMLLPSASQARWSQILEKGAQSGAQGIWEALPHVRAPQASLRVLDGRQMQFNLDGEPLEALHINFRVCPGALSLRLPVTTSLTRLP